MNVEEILAKVCEPDACGCWPWENPAANGYGRVMGRNAHVVIYEVFGFEIPDGFLLDHLCLFKACVNPAHMEPVPLIVNTRRHFDFQFEVSA